MRCQVGLTTIVKAKSNSGRGLLVERRIMTPDMDGISHEVTVVIKSIKNGVKWDAVMAC